MTTATLTNNSSRLATFVVFWSCVIVVGAGVQVMPHWFTKRLATSTEDLVQLGSISAESGYNRRRVSNDLSWIGLSEGDKVFSGDRIYTGDQSSVTLKLADGTKIRLRPRSLVQISLGRNGLYIDLSQGEVETEPKSQSVTIHTIDEDRVEKAQPEVRPTPKPVAVATATPRPVPTAIPIPAPASFATYPKNESQVFFTRSRHLIAVAGARCKKSCIVKAYKDGEIWTTAMHSAGDVPNIELTLEPKTRGDVTLELEDDMKISTSKFTLSPYSTDAVAQALAKNRALEILE